MRTSAMSVSPIAKAASVASRPPIVIDSSDHGAGSPGGPMKYLPGGDTLRMVIRPVTGSILLPELDAEALNRDRVSQTVTRNPDCNCSAEGRALDPENSTRPVTVTGGRI